MKSTKKQRDSIIQRMEFKMSVENDKVLFEFDNGFFWLDGEFDIQSYDIFASFSVNGIEEVLKNEDLTYIELRALAKYKEFLESEENAMYIQETNDYLDLTRNKN